MRNLILAAAVVPLVIAGCTPGGKMDPAQVQAGISLGLTLAQIAAANNKSVAAVVTQGQLFCQKEGAYVAVVNSATDPNSVIGQAGSAVAAVCGGLGAGWAPAPPPPLPAAVPAVTVPVAALPSQPKI